MVKTDSTDDLVMGASGTAGQVPGGPVFSIGEEGECECEGMWDI